MTFCPWWNECELLIQVAGAAAQCLGIGDKRGGGVVCHDDCKPVTFGTRVCENGGEKKGGRSTKVNPIQRFTT